MEPSSLAGVAFAFVSGLFAFLSLWSKLKYDADRIRLDAKVDELARDNADLRTQLADERKTCDERIGKLENKLAAHEAGGRSATPEEAVLKAQVVELENELALRDPAFAARLEVKRKAMNPA